MITIGGVAIAWAPGRAEEILRMRLPRPRFTVRRLMVAVAVAGLVFSGLAWGDSRRARFSAIASSHVDMYNLLELDLILDGKLGSTPRSPESLSLLKAQVVHELRMARKYRYAARYPWLPVAPDPPEPQ